MSGVTWTRPNRWPRLVREAAPSMAVMKPLYWPATWGDNAGIDWLRMGESRFQVSRNRLDTGSDGLTDSVCTS